MKDSDISQVVKETLNLPGVVFNPSIAEVEKDLYIISVRSFANNKTLESKQSPKSPYKNPQHPWTTTFKGIEDKKEDSSYIFLAKMTDDDFQILDWNIKLDVQDLRIFKFYGDEANNAYILTYNKAYVDHPNYQIKGGDSCEDWCYIIGWSYLITDVHGGNPVLLESVEPLCLNISEKIDKNWSLWNLIKDGKVYPMISYLLSPTHIAFNWRISGVVDDKISGGYSCKLITPSQIDLPQNFFKRLESHWDNQLYVSLSTPAYSYGDGYQAVGHIKVRVKYIESLIRKGVKNSLTKVYNNAIKSHLHQTFVYFMFVYRFRVEEVRHEVSSKFSVDLPELSKRLELPVFELTPAFVVSGDYLLNFPSGMVIKEDSTLISYGDGDYYAKIFEIPDSQLNSMMKGINKWRPETYPFKVLE